MVSNRKGSKSSSIRFATKKHIKFKNNQHTVEKDTTKTSASAKKLRNCNDFKVASNPTIEYCIINFCSVFSVLSTFIKCKQCN